MTDKKVAQKFFDTYTHALLERDAKAIAEQYAVPALIEFPEQRLVVTSTHQAEEFFAGAFGQYDSVSTAEADVKVVAATSHSIWADVTWKYDGGAPNEQNMYQLTKTQEGWKIAVLTPLDK